MVYSVVESIRQVVNTKDTNQITNFIEENISTLFSSLSIPDYYKEFKEIDLNNFSSNIPKLAISWMAFVCGDHANMFKIMNTISELQLKTKEESSFFYGLKAFMNSMLGVKDGLKYAQLSIDILPDEDTLYKANGYLTYGQLLAGNNKYRLAQSAFNKAANIFKSLDLSFLFVISKTNELLNLYRLGEYDNIFSQTNELLLSSSSFTEKVEDYWTIIDLPVGMCFFELNRPTLALKYLLETRRCIDASKLLHLHGLTELYLFKTYYLLNDWNNIKKLMNELEQTFNNLYYPQIKILLSLFRIYYHDGVDITSDIELFEYEYQKGNTGFGSIIEGLVYLKLKGLSDLIKTADLLNLLENYRFIGNIPELQKTLIQLTELSLIDKNETNAYLYLKEAVEIYQQYGIYSYFNFLPLKSLELLRKINNTLYKTLNIELNNSINGDLLTDREIEIIKLISLGKSNNDISNELYISVGTIKWHINNIFSKLDVKNRVQAIEKAKSMKLL